MSNSGEIHLSAIMVGRITTAGVVTTEHAIPTASAGPIGITVGSNGELWWAENTANAIGTFVNTCVTPATEPPAAAGQVAVAPAFTG